MEREVAKGKSFDKRVNSCKQQEERLKKVDVKDKLQILRQLNMDLKELNLVQHDENMEKFRMFMERVRM